MGIEEKGLPKRSKSVTLCHGFKPKSKLAQIFRRISGEGWSTSGLSTIPLLFAIVIDVVSSDACEELMEEVLYAMIWS